MTIREYFETIEDLETRWAEEGELWEELETNEDFDFEAWAEAHDVDLDAVDARMGLSVVTLWSWDMCGGVIPTCPPGRSVHKLFTNKALTNHQNCAIIIVEKEKEIYHEKDS